MESFHRSRLVALTILHDHTAMLDLNQLESSRVHSSSNTFSGLTTHIKSEAKITNTSKVLLSSLAMGKTLFKNTSMATGVTYQTQLSQKTVLCEDKESL
jgi:hypothetical protein